MVYTYAFGNVLYLAMKSIFEQCVLKFEWNKYSGYVEDYIIKELKYCKHYLTTCN
jgi:hypothetical protein